MVSIILGGANVLRYSGATKNPNILQVFVGFLGVNFLTLTKYI